MQQLNMLNEMLNGFFLAESEGVYNAFNVTDDEIIRQAQEIATKRFNQRKLVNSPAEAKSLIWGSMQNLENEVFACLFLDTKHQVISFEKMFFGSIDNASVYPREVVKKALQLNAAAVIFTHNHPSMDSTPSRADIDLTLKLKEALALIDVRVLDHIIVGADTYSLTENADI